MSDTAYGFFAFLRRYRYCAGCAVVTLVAILGAWFLRGEIRILQLMLSDRAKQGNETLSTLVGGSTTRQELAFVREVTRRIDENLLVETNLAENLWYFYKLEEQTKVRLPELHQLSSPPNDKSPLYRRIPYTLRITGTYEQVAAFVLALETGPRLVKITNFSYSRADPQGSTLALDLGVELLGKR
jgi:Tfp pilus assembly protein PilO